jgi:ABC-type antimicrobial peptide transport system permease subunit
MKPFVPLAPTGPLLSLTASTLAQCVGIGAVAGVVAGLYPAWRASRLPPAEASKAG